MPKEHGEPQPASSLKQELTLPEDATPLQHSLFEGANEAILNPKSIESKLQEANRSTLATGNKDWYSIVHDEDILSIFPKYYHLFPQSFGRQYTQNTLVIHIIKDLLDYQKSEPIRHILQQGIDKFKAMFPTLPTVEVGYTISLGMAVPRGPIRLDHAFYQTVAINTDTKVDEISYFLPTEILDDMDGTATNYTYTFANQKLPDKKMIPGVIEVVGVHEYTHALLSHICNFEFADGPESLTSAIAEAFTVLAERVYAFRQRSAAEKEGNSLLFSSFDFILQSRNRTLTSRKNDVYSYGYLVIIKALQRHFRTGIPISTQEEFITGALKFLKSLDLEKISQIHIHSHEAKQIATNPVGKLPLK